ncbi:MAG: T9SS C-terminal target domain-containing protein [Calditrichaeota bacterium]|nr:MAG: T9SS C-terminal target domain-containing protein [Calditrichota bacterium]
MKLKCTAKISIAVAAFCFCVENSSIAQDWPMLNKCKERTSWASEETVLLPPLEIKTKMSLKSNGTHIGDLALVDNILSVAAQNTPNTLEVFDIQTGDTLWTFQIPNTQAAMNFTCAQTDSLIFAGGQLGLGLYALDRETGEQKWHKPIGPLFTKNIILDAPNAYILGDSLYCLRITDGATVWSKKIQLQATPAVDESQVYIVGNLKIQIYDKNDGTLVWERATSQSSSGAIAIDELNFYTFSNDTMFSFNKSTREVNWFYHRPGVTLQIGNQNGLAISDSKLCFNIRSNADKNGQIVTLNKATGAFLWERTFIGEFVFAPVIANGVVYVVPFPEKTLYGYNIENGAQLFFDNSEDYRYQPIVVNHRLYAIAGPKIVVFGNVETSVEATNNELPHEFELMQNYPNPFNPVTTIKFNLPMDEFVTLKIYDKLGHEIAVLLNEKRAHGLHSINFDGRDFASGLYFYKITAGKFSSTKKFLLLK